MYREVIGRNEVKINPISEFGIGILSSYMIADSIIIETFMESENALRLEINDIGQDIIVRLGSRKEAGTRVELNLKDSVVKDLSDMKLIEIVKHYIRHVEIPIKVVGASGRESEVNDAGYEFQLSELLDPFKLEKLKDYQV